MSYVLQEQNSGTYPTHARRYVVLACIGFLVGVFVQNIPGMWYTQLAMVACIAVGVQTIAPLRAWGYVVGIPLVGVVCGTYLYANALAHYTHLYDAVYDSAQPGAHTYTGVVVSDRDEREDAVVVDVALVGHMGADGDTQYADAPYVRLYMPRSTHIAYADRVEVTGKIVPPKIITPNNGTHNAEAPHEASAGIGVSTVFDYPAYLRTQGVVGEMRFAKVVKVCMAEAKPLDVDVLGVTCSTGFTERLFTLLYALKHTYRDAVRTYIAEPYASLALGITIGEKHGLSADENTMFTRAGLSHVVVLSGYNISLLITLAFYLLALVPISRGWVLSSGAVAAVLFVLMTGASATAVRALVMALIAALGTYMYRSAVPLMSLLVVSVGLVAWNPFMLRDDVSFQLSALATLGILLFGTRWSAWWAQRVGSVVGTTLGTTFAASVYTVPLVMYTFGTASIVAPLANVLVLPLIEPATVLTLALGVLGSVPLMLAHGAATLLAYIAYVLLATVFVIVEACADIPYASVALPLPGAGMAVWWCAVSVYASITHTSEARE